MWQGTLSEFITKYGPYVVSEAKGSGVFPAIIVGSAQIESRADGSAILGTHANAKEANNFFNIRADSSWKGPVYNAANGAWRKYIRIEDSISDYIKFLKANSNYAKAGVFTAANIDAQAQALQRAGYAGGDLLYSQVLASVAHNADKLLAGVHADSKQLIAVMAGLAVVGVGVVFWPKKKGISGLSNNELGLLLTAASLAVSGAAWYYTTQNDAPPPNKPYTPSISPPVTPVDPGVTPVKPTADQGGALNPTSLIPGYNPALPNQF